MLASVCGSPSRGRPRAAFGPQSLVSFEVLVSCCVDSWPKTRRESTPCGVTNPCQVCASKRGAGAPFGDATAKVCTRTRFSRCAYIPLPGRIPKGVPAPPCAGAPSCGSRLAWRRFRGFSSRNRKLPIVAELAFPFARVFPRINGTGHADTTANSKRSCHDNA